MDKQFKGVFVAATTPFLQDGGIDVPAMHEHVEFLLREGMDGVFAGGTYAEGPLLGRDYGTYFQALGDAVKGRIPIIAQVGAPDTRTVIELADMAAAAGMDSIAAVPPFYYAHDEDAIVSYYKDIVSSSKLPLFIYNNPARTGNDVSPRLFERLIKLEKVIGCKDSSNSLAQFCKYAEVAPEGFSLLMGSDDLMLGGLAMGAQGVVVVVANVTPGPIRDFYRAFEAGNYAEARRLQFKVYEYRSALKGPYIATYKEALNLKGLNGGYTRKPLRGLTSEEKDSLKKRLQAVGLL